MSVYVQYNRPGGTSATQHNTTQHTYTEATLQPDWEGTVMGLGAHPCITGLALTQGYGAQIDPLRLEPLRRVVGVAAEEMKRAREGKDMGVPRRGI